MHNLIILVREIRERKRHLSPLKCTYYLFFLHKLSNFFINHGITMQIKLKVTKGVLQNALIYTRN